MATWALIGGAGVFAAHTAKLLLDEGQRVVAIGRNPPKPRHYSLGVGEGNPSYRYEQIHATFEVDRLCELLAEEKPEIVVNFAALAYATSWQHAHRFYDTNLMSVVRLAEWLAGKYWLTRFVQIGTSELYGSCEAPATEDSPLKPTSPYAVSKMAADLHLLTMQRVKGLPVVILRPSNAYGEGQQVWRVIPRACLCAAGQDRLPLEGGGRVEKSYIHAADLARAVYLSATVGTEGEVYNCGPATPVSIREVVATIADLAGIPFEHLVSETAGRAGEDQRYWLDSSKIAALGWAPEIDLRTGLERTLIWAHEHFDALRGEAQQFVLRA